jgi:hypothetical protein
LIIVINVVAFVAEKFFCLTGEITRGGTKMAYSYDRQIASAGACVHLIGHMQGRQAQAWPARLQNKSLRQVFCPVKTIGLSARGGDTVIHWMSHDSRVALAQHHRPEHWRSTIASEDGNTRIVVSGECYGSRNGVKTNVFREF